MTDIKLYCLASRFCARVGKEKASIRRRGLFGEAGHRFDRVTGYVSIIALHAKARNAFMEWHV